MDFIVSYYLYNKIRREELNKPLFHETPIIKPIIKIDEIDEVVSKSFLNRTCGQCGQNPYFCQCKENIKLMYRNFNPEKDRY